MKTLIIEDEILAAESLENLIHDIDPEIEVLANLQSIDESVEWLNSNPMPDFIFMDIHLADGFSFAIFDEVTVDCPVIFTTAYDEHALKAFQVNGIAYLLKPIKKIDLENAIKKCKRFVQHTNYDSNILKNLIDKLRSEEKTNHKTLFLIHQKDKLIPLHIKDIAYIYIDFKMVKAVTFSEEVFYLEQTLDEIYEQLHHTDFFRANRQYIISRNAVKDLSVWFGSKISVGLSIPTPEKIIISKARASEFKKWFSGD